MGCSSSINAVPKLSEHGQSEDARLLGKISEQDVQTWVESLPNHIKTKIKNSELLPCDGSLLDKWNTQYLMQSGILDETTAEQVLVCKRSLLTKVKEGRTMQDICSNASAVQMTSAPKEPENTSTSILDKPLHSIEELKPFSQMKWIEKGADYLPKVKVFLKLVKHAVPSPGDAAVGILITITDLCHKVLCNHKNIHSLHSRLLDLAHILGCHHEKLKCESDIVRRVLEKFNELCKRASSYVQSYTDQHWIMTVLNVAADKSKYETLNKRITDVVSEIKLVMVVDVQRNVEEVHKSVKDVLENLQKVVEYVDTNSGLKCKIEELGGVKELANDPQKLSEVIDELPEGGQKLALELQCQVLSLLKEKTREGPFNLIDQPQLRTFWAITFPTNFDLPWAWFWRAIQVQLVNILAPAEVPETLNLIGSESSRLKLESCLKNPEDPSKVSVLELKAKVPAVVPLLQALEQVLKESVTGAASVPGCKPVPPLDNKLVGRDADVQSVVQLLTKKPAGIANVSGVMSCVILAPGGTGKSSLAQAVAQELELMGVLKGGGAIYVDLQLAIKEEEVMGRIWAALGMKPESDHNTDTMAVSVATHIAAAASKGPILLVMDNAEDALHDEKSAILLQAVVAKFHAVVPELLTLITSRVPFPKVDGVELPTYKLDNLHLEDALTLARKCAPKLTAAEVETVVKVSSGVPLTITMAARAIMDGRMTAKQMMDAAQTNGEGASNVSILLSDLPAGYLNALIPLSTFNSSFFLEDAAAVLASPSTEDARLQLNELVHRCLAQRSLNSYFLHPSVRFTLVDGTKTSKEGAEVHQAAQVRLVLHIFDMLREWAAMARRDSEAAHCALTLARGRQSIIDAGVSLLLSSSTLPDEVWLEATRTLSQANVLDFLAQTSLGYRTDLLDVASKILNYWEGQAQEGDIILSRASAMLLKATCLMNCGAFKEAQTLLDACVAIRRETLGETEETLDSVLALARCLDSLGLYAQEQELYEKLLKEQKHILGEQHSKILKTEGGLAQCLWQQGKYDAAHEMYAATLKTQEATLDSKHPDLLTSMDKVAACLQKQGHHKAANELFDKVLELRKSILGPEHPDVLVSMNNLASCWLVQGHHQEARLLYEDVLEMRKRILGAEHPGVLASMGNLAGCLLSQGNHKAAHELREDVLKIRKHMFGEEHPEVLTSMSDLAACLRDQGKHQQARELFEKVLEARKRVLGADHPDVLTSMTDLALCVEEQGHHADARKLLEDVLEARQCSMGPDHPDTLVSMYALASCVRKQGHHTEALEQLTTVLDKRRRIFGSEHPDVLASMDSVAGCLRDLGDYRASREMCETILRMRTQILGEEHPDVLESMNNLAVSLGCLSQAQEAHDLYLKVVDLRKRVQGLDHPDLLQGMSHLAFSMNIMGQFEASLELYKQVLDARERILGKDHPDVARTLDMMANCLLAKEDNIAAREILEKVVQMREQILGENHQDTIASKEALGKCLFGLNEFRESRELFERVLQVRQRLQGLEHPKMRTCLEYIAVCLATEGDFIAACGYYEKLLNAEKRNLGPKHWRTIAIMQELADYVLNLVETQEGLELYKSMSAVQTDLLESEDLEILKMLASLAGSLKECGELKASCALNEQVQEKLKAVCPPEGQKMLDVKNCLAVLLTDQGQYDNALVLFKEVSKMREDTLGSEDSAVLTTMSDFARCLQLRGDGKEALDLFQAVLQKNLSQHGSEHPEVLTGMSNLARCLKDLGRLEEARDLFANVLEKRKQLFQPGHIETLKSMIDMATCLNDQGRCDDARDMYESALEAGRKVLKQDHRVILKLEEGYTKILDNQQTKIVGQ